jgi:hypothetical protein
MAEFIVELYIARATGDAAETCAEHARAAADAVSRSGTPVRCVSSIFVPEDETCFLLYEADTVDAVRTAAEHAGLAFERVALAHASRGVKD